MTTRTPIPIPPLGFGLWKLAPEACADAVYEAIKAGYRHLDGACDYGNEAAVGRAWPGLWGMALPSGGPLDHVKTLEYLSRSGARTPRFGTNAGGSTLRLPGSFLIHFPIALAYVPFETRYPPEWVYDPEAPDPAMVRAPVSLQATWAAMEKLQAAGKVRHLGVANYNSGLLHDLMAYAQRAPSVLQIEAHPYLTQERLVRLAQDYGLAVTAFSPLGAGSYLELGMAEAGEQILNDPVVLAIAERHGRTPAQVVLRWALQRGTSVVVKSTRPERMAENLAAHDFTLDEDAMAALSALNRNRRFNDPGAFCEEAFGTFIPSMTEPTFPRWLRRRRRWRRWTTLASGWGSTGVRCWGRWRRRGLCCFAAFLCGLRKISMPSLGLSNSRPLPTRSPSRTRCGLTRPHACLRRMKHRQR